MGWLIRGEVGEEPVVHGGYVEPFQLFEMLTS